MIGRAREWWQARAPRQRLVYRLVRALAALGESRGVAVESATLKTPVCGGGL